MSKRNSKHIYQKSGVLLAFTLLASLAAAVQYAFRITAVFADGGYDKGTFIASKLTLGVNGYRLEA